MSDRNRSNKTIKVSVMLILVFTFAMLYNTTKLTSFLNNTGLESDSNTTPSSATINTFGGLHFGIGEILILLVALVGIGIVIYYVVFIKSKTNDVLEIKKDKEIPLKEFQAFIGNIDMQDFKKDRLAELEEIQNSIMNFEYENLKEKMTDKLYSQVETEMKPLSMNNEKNIIKDFKVIDSVVTHANRTNDKCEVSIEALVTAIDYVEKNGLVLKGNSTTPVKKLYNLSYESKVIKASSVCPTCNAPIEDKNLPICPYCRHKVNQESTKWIMSKKSVKIQK